MAPRPRPGALPGHAAVTIAATITSRLFGVGLFGAVSLVLTGIAGMLWYETYAVGSGRAPTLSRILAYSIDTAPPQLAVWVAATVGLLAGIVGTVLALHFAGLLSFWRP